MAGPADYKVETLLENVASTIGEGPHWEESSGKLLYVDINTSTVGRFHVETKVNEQIKLEGSTSLIVPSDGGRYVVSSQRKLCHLDWDTKTLTDIVEVPSLGTNDRFNDGKCDRQGRLWAGTMGSESAPAVPEVDKGRLFTLDKGKMQMADKDPIQLSNGLAWTSDDTVMYFIDSTPRVIYAYDFDSASGAIANKRVVIDFNQWTLTEAGYPDGMSIDQDGKLWIAGFFSSKVMQFDPVTGQRLRYVTLPTDRITSCCFGGKDYSELFVTSANSVLVPTSEPIAREPPLAGSIFKVTGIGAKGFAGPNYIPS